MATLRRQVKNMVKNYSEAEVKVREATSNDPWGPSSTLMSEISDLTYNIVALGEVMRMIWKRLNDHGKNWRHVYKSLVLLDYLIKNGNEKVAQQCKEHIVAIQTLKDFQYMEEQKDQGASVREKAKQLVNLLRDDERLKQERTKAFKARERFAQNAMGISSDNKLTFATSNINQLTQMNRIPYTGMSSKTSGNYADPYGGARGSTDDDLNASGASGLAPDLEAVRPSDANEEDLQIKLAIMLSQQEHEEEVQRKRADEAKLQIALEQSKSEGQPNGPKVSLDLVDLGENDPWSSSFNNNNKVNNNNNANTLKLNHHNEETDSDDFFPPLSSLNKPNDPWSMNGTTKQQTNGSNGQTNPWGLSNNNIIDKSDPWSSSSTSSNANVKKVDEFDLFTSNRANQSLSPTNINTNSNDLNDPFGDFFGSSTVAAVAAAPTNVLSAQPSAKNNSTNPWNANDANKFDSLIAPLGSDIATSSAVVNKPPIINPTRKTPESFLGENSSLVNLENLIPARPKSTNPFGANANAPQFSTLTTSSSSGQLNNPFMSQQQMQNQKGPTISQLQQQSAFPSFALQNNSTPPAFGMGQLAQPLIVSPPSTNIQNMMPLQFNNTNTTNSSSMAFGNQAFAIPTAQQQFQPFGAANNNSSSTGTTNPFLMM